MKKGDQADYGSNYVWSPHEAKGRRATGLASTLMARVVTPEIVARTARVGTRMGEAYVPL